MTMAGLKNWLRQPTTIHGIAVLVGGIAAAGAELLSHNEVLAGICAWVAYGATHILVSDNSADISSVEKMVQDAVTALVQKRVGATMPLLLSDVQAAFVSLRVPDPVPVPVPAPAPPAPPIAVASIQST